MKEIKAKLYVSDITKVPYDKLKKDGIKVLMLDFDDTIMSRKNKVIEKEVLDILKRLEKDFKLIIISNCPIKFRIKKYIDRYPIVARAIKPFKKGLKKALKIAKVEPCEVALIGDRLLTDILGGNKMGFYTILIDPLERHPWFYRFYSKILIGKDR